jgi:hypothetical protein
VHQFAGMDPEMISSLGDMTSSSDEHKGSGALEMQHVYGSSTTEADENHRHGSVNQTFRFTRGVKWVAREHYIHTGR